MTHSNGMKFNEKKTSGEKYLHYFLRLVSTIYRHHNDFVSRKSVT